MIILSGNNFIHLFQQELEVAKLEIQKWHSAFQYGPATPTGMSTGFFLKNFFNHSFLSFGWNVFSSFTGYVDIEPGLVLTYLQNLKSSEESLKEQVGWILHFLMHKLIT